MSRHDGDAANVVAAARDSSTTAGRVIEDVTLEKRRRPDIRGKRQSPINIDLGHTREDQFLAKLRLSYYADAGARLVNDGILPVCYVTPGTHLLSGGPLSDEYELVQFHIHFSGKCHGSEHEINGNGYPAEIHFVHYKREYGDFQSALQHPDGLAVVGAFIDVDNNNVALHQQLDADILKMVNIVECGAKYATSVDLAKYEMSKCERFFTYSGSLTSEPCQECVEWILLKEPLAISNEAFEVLKLLRTATGSTVFEKGNARAVQDGSGRQIRCNFALDEMQLS